MGAGEPEPPQQVAPASPAAGAARERLRNPKIDPETEDGLVRKLLTSKLAVPVVVLALAVAVSTSGEQRADGPGEERAASSGQPPEEALAGDGTAAGAGVPAAEGGDASSESSGGGPGGTAERREPARPSSGGAPAPAASPGTATPSPSPSPTAPVGGGSPAPTPGGTAAGAAGAPRATARPPATTGRAPTTTTTTTTAPKRWIAVTRVAGGADRRGPAFRLSGAEARLRFEYQGDRLFLVYLLEAGRTVEQSGPVSYAEVSCSSACRGGQRLAKPKGDYYLDVRAMSGSWSVVVEEYR